MEGLGTTLRKLLEALDGGVQSHYDALGSNFRPRFFPVARLLLAGEALSIRALADATGVSHSAVSQTVAEMRVGGLVESAPGQDGRERRVKLTEAGLAVCDQLQSLWVATERAATALDDELPMPLGNVLRQAAARLQAESFAARIEHQLQKEAAQ